MEDVLLNRCENATERMLEYAATLEPKCKPTDVKKKGQGVAAAGGKKQVGGREGWAGGCTGCAELLWLGGRWWAMGGHAGGRASGRVGEQVGGMHRSGIGYLGLAEACMEEEHGAGTSTGRAQG